MIIRLVKLRQKMHTRKLIQKISLIILFRLQACPWGQKLLHWPHPRECRLRVHFTNNVRNQQVKTLKKVARVTQTRQALMKRMVPLSNHSKKKQRRSILRCLILAKCQNHQKSTRNRKYLCISNCHRGKIQTPSAQVWKTPLWKFIRMIRCLPKEPAQRMNIQWKSLLTTRKQSTAAM